MQLVLLSHDLNEKSCNYPWVKEVEIPVSCDIINIGFIKKLFRRKNIKSWRKVVIMMEQSSLPIFISQMRSILRNHQIVRVIILSTYRFRHREKNSLFKILVYHCQLNHNLWSYQSSTTKVSSVHNKHMTYPICTYEFDSSFIKSSNKFRCLLERK